MPDAVYCRLRQIRDRVIKSSNLNLPQVTGITSSQRSILLQLVCVLALAVFIRRSAVLILSIRLNNFAIV